MTRREFQDSADRAGEELLLLGLPGRIIETGAGGHDLSLNEVAAMRIICTNPTTAPKMRPAR